MVRIHPAGAAILRGRCQEMAMYSTYQDTARVRSGSHRHAHFRPEIRRGDTHDEADKLPATPSRKPDVLA